MTEMTARAAPPPCTSAGPSCSALPADGAQGDERVFGGTIAAAHLAAADAGLAELVGLQDSPVCPPELIGRQDGPRVVEPPPPPADGTPPLPRALDQRVLVRQLDPLVAGGGREALRAQMD